MNLELFTLIWMHFLADFVLQSDKMAINKSKEKKWLLIHCVIYGLPFLFFGWRFSLLCVTSHFVVDFVTSRITSKLWQLEKRYWFFVTIGFDQAIHLTLLGVFYGRLSDWSK